MDADLRHKKRRKVRGKAQNSSAERTIHVKKTYEEKRAAKQATVEAFRKKNTKAKLFSRRKV